ncbi:hypothetical protein ACFQGT_07670 [Natrialbaceae archaeon GCM10025810]
MLIRLASVAVLSDRRRTVLPFTLSILVVLLGLVVYFELVTLLQQAVGG